MSSCDNLNGDFEPDRLLFMSKVQQEVCSILSTGLLRVQMLAEALAAFIRRVHWWRAILS